MIPFFQAIYNVIMFVDFYYKRYIKENKKIKLVFRVTPTHPITVDAYHHFSKKQISSSAQIISRMRQDSGNFRTPNEIDLDTHLMFEQHYRDYEIDHFDFGDDRISH